MYIRTAIFTLMISLVLIPSSAQAQPYYECLVASDAARGGVCEQHRGRVHKCQLYDGYSGGIPNHCSNFCVERSEIPAACAVVTVGVSSNPEAHQGKAQVEEQLGIDIEDLGDIGGEVQSRLQGIENEINVDDGVDADEIQHVVGRVVAVIRDILGERLGDTVSKVTDKVKEVFTGSDDPEETSDDDDEDLEELTEEDFFDTGLDSTGFNEYKAEKWPDEDGTKIAKIVDPYGVERYTSDGKHFYDSPYDAAHSGEGFSNVVNGVKGAWESVKGVFSFETKLKDEDKELQRKIAREVLDDAKSNRQKDIEKAYEKLSDKVKAPALADVPASAVIEVAKEARASDFAQGALLYIEQREEGKSQANIKANLSEELSEGYGTFGEGVSLSTVNEYAPAVLFARYEEAYQRYRLAKEFGRTE